MPAVKVMRKSTIDARKVKKSSTILRNLDTLYSRTHNVSPSSRRRIPEGERGTSAVSSTTYPRNWTGLASSIGIAAIHSLYLPHHNRPVARWFYASTNFPHHRLLVYTQQLNAALLQTGQWDEVIISMVGKTVGFDGSSTLSFECADGGKIQVSVSPEYEFTPGKAAEIVGAAQSDGTVQVGCALECSKQDREGCTKCSTHSFRPQYFIERELTEGFDFDNYNQLISKVMNQPKYQDMFGYTS